MTSAPGRLEGRNAVVTGAGSGIGLRIAQELHAAGATVTLVDINAAAITDVARDLGDRVSARTADVTDEAQVQAAIDAAAGAFGPLHIAVNAAGTGGLAPILDLELVEWRRVADLCLTGVFLSIKHQARRMTEGGSIINIASLNGRQPAEGMAAYCAAKAGVEMLTKVAAMELGPRGIRVNAISPGLIDTPLTSPFTRSPIQDEFLDNIPLGRIGATADVAAAALFLAGDHAAWITGDTLLVDGGAHTKRYPALLGRFAPPPSRPPAAGPRIDEGDAE
ncbi:SDR family oxidoreductase [Actinomadura sp. LD22]|uniref:SDR family oxidoreductase n=1 Tax=Actinomadura physcomitrii TaxID=2650748 RepID=A0A6I4MC65_9ACTN|nr:SDR family NAD(P)-dependent oxidoreductase [Actinomadura physcomitrii]MWA01577.1 SDR family oxidoreductase [Actinomadura physcomitrii]